MPFRILTLSGGGARGIFQATYLRLLGAELKRPLVEHFDLISGTSTGALLGLALAHGIEPSEISRVYLDHSSRIFRHRTLAKIRRGPRLDQLVLREVLETYFGETKLGELERDVLIPATAVNHFEGKVFTRGDRNTTLVDAALASAAAPTYYPPVKPPNLERSFADGGLWANDPSFLAVHHAINQIDQESDDIWLLAIGTGRMTRGRPPTELEGLRTISLKTLRYYRELLDATQSWYAESLCDATLRSDQLVRIDPELQDWIGLDDFQSANNMLPARAERIFTQTKKKVLNLVSQDGPAPKPREVADDLPPELLEGVSIAKLTRFVPARQYYARFRKGRETISSYVALANHTLTMVSVNLATGLDMEKVCRVFNEMITDRDNPVCITVSLLNPEDEYLFKSLAPVLEVPASELKEQVYRSLNHLTDFSASLPKSRQDRFQIRCHRALPPASAILIDADEPTGLIQLETRAYKGTYLQSFGFEVAAGSELYSTLHLGYTQLVKDGTEWHAGQARRTDE